MPAKSGISRRHMSRSTQLSCLSHSAKTHNSYSHLVQCALIFLCLNRKQAVQLILFYWVKLFYFLPGKELNYTLQWTACTQVEDLLQNVLCYWLSAKIVISNVIIALLRFNDVIYTVKVSHRPLRGLRQLYYFHIFNVAFEQQYTLDWKRHFALTPHLVRPSMCFSNVFFQFCRSNGNINDMKIWKGSEVLHFTVIMII